MKKLVLAAVAVCMGVPVLAQEAQPAAEPNQKPALEQRDPGHEAFAKAHQEQMAKIKATEEKMSKLVGEYNKLKPGKKKDAKRAEIANEVAAIHEEQLKFKQDQLGKFEERLSAMKAEFAQENTDEKKQEWVNQKTDALIENEGKLNVLFDPRGGQGPRMGGPQGPRMGGPRGPHKRGFFGRHNKGPRMDGDKQLPPPPDAELPVQKPVEK